MEWPGKAGFNAAPEYSWRGTFGTLRTYGRFTFLRVKEAGHMVPMDQPGVALFMLDDFTRGAWGAESAVDENR